MSNTSITQDVFATLGAELSAFIKERLKYMQLDFTDVELHNSSTTKTVRAYITLKRTTNLKALTLAEQTIIKEIEEKFQFHPYAFYWRYRAED
jgi:ribosome maturation factor RimP